MSLQGRILGLLEVSFSSLRCFHGYPDSVVIADVYKKGNFFAEYFCLTCNKSFLRYLPENELISSFREKIKRDGRMDYRSVEEHRAFREKVVK